MNDTSIGDKITSMYNPGLLRRYFDATMVQKTRRNRKGFNPLPYPPLLSSPSPSHLSIFLPLVPFHELLKKAVAKLVIHVALYQTVR